MSEQSWKRRWSDQYPTVMHPTDGLPAVAEKIRSGGGPLAEWTLIKMPDGPVHRYLSYAAEVGCVGYDEPLRRTFLDWAVQVGEAAISDSRWSWEEDFDPRTQWNAVYFHGPVLGLTALARGWADDTTPSAERLLQAAGEVAQDPLDTPSSGWNEQGQARYLWAVQCALLAGDVPRAREMLKVRKKFARIKQYYDWFAGFMQGLGDAVPTSAAPESLAAHFDQFFDQVRDPEFRPPQLDKEGRNLPDNLLLLRLRLAVLRWMYVEGQPVAGHWRDILAQIVR